MAYFKQDGAMHGYNGLSGYVRPAPVTRVVCDDCGKAEVPHEMTEGGRRMHARPWKWAPRYGTKCEACGTDC